MAVTYLQICKNVRAQAGLAGDGPTNVVNQSGIYEDVVRWVDEAYNEIQSMYENWNFLHTTVVDVLPATADELNISAYRIRQITKSSFLIQFENGNKERLKYVPFAEWEATDMYLKAKDDKPAYVTELPTGELKFWPNSSTLDYNIHFSGFSRPDIMTSSADTPIFHEQWADLIKLKALMKYGEYYNSTEVFRSAEKNFNKMIKKMEFSELPRDSLKTPNFVPFA